MKKRVPLTTLRFFLLLIHATIFNPDSIIAGDARDCPLTVSAGDDVTICACTTFPCACTQIVLSGAYSGNAPGANISVSWTANPASANAWISNPSALNPTVTIPCLFSGTVTFQLQVQSTSPGCSGTDAMTLTVLPVTSPGATFVHATCNMNGSINIVQLTGGTGPFTFLWSTGATTQNLVNEPPGQYTVTVTNSEGCTRAGSWPISGSSSITINVNNPNICDNGGSVNLNVTGSNLVSFSWSGGQTGNPVTVTMPGTYTVTATDANGCTGTDEAVVTAIPGPMVDILGPSTVCSAMLPAILTASGGNFSLVHWSTNQNGSSINVNTTGTYSVTVTDANGCTDTNSQMVSIFTTPTPGISGPSQICSGDEAMLTVTGGVFPGIVWSTGETTSTISATNQGNYTVTVTDANGCTATATKFLTVNPSPEFDNYTGTACIGTVTHLNTLNFTGQNIAGATLVMYGGFPPGPGNQIPMNIVLGGDTTVYAIGTSPQGCKDTFMIQLMGLPQPNSGFNSMNVLQCVGPSGYPVIQLEDLILGEDPGGIWQVASGSAPPGNNFNAANGTFDPNGLPAGTYVFNYRVTNNCGISTTNCHVQIVSTPTATVNTTPSACSGVPSGTLTVTSTTGPSPFLFDIGNGNTNNPVFTGLAAGSYIVTITDANNCATTVFATVGTLSGVMPVISGTTSLCQSGANGILNAGSFAGYVWSTGETTSTINISMPGTYTVTASDINGCTGTDTQVVAALPNPAPVISGPIEICSPGGAATLSTGNFPTISWSGSQSGNSININAPGTYSVTVTAANGCTGTDDYTVAPLAVPVPVIDVPSPQCLGVPATLEVSGGSFAEIEWSNAQSGASITVSPPGLYAVTVTAANGCTGAVSQFVGILQTPAPVITGPNITCAGSPVTLDAGDDFDTYLWSNGVSTQTMTTTVPGSYTVTVTESNGCTGSNSFFISASPQVNASAGADQIICPGNSAMLTASGGSGFMWSNGQTTSSIIVTPLQSTTYTVEVSADGLCSGMDSVRVLVAQEYQQTLQFQICPDDSVMVGNTVFNNLNPTGTVSLTSTAGCDSIIDVALLFYPVFDQDITVFTCNPTQVGSSVQQFQSQYGCDSTVTTHVVFDPSAVDTTFLTAHTCDPSQSGFSTQTLTGADGCDSVLITTTLLHSSPVVNLTSFTCHPAQVGTVTQVFQTAFGCDSTVVTNTIFDQQLIDTTYLTANTCDSTMAGMTTATLAGGDGCDSVVILNTILRPSPVVNISLSTCNPAQAGVFTLVYQTLFGCDSIVVTNIIFDPLAADTTYLTANTCDPAMVGISSVAITGADGCDSVLITNTVLQPSPVVTFSFSTCNPAQAGTVTQVFQTAFGCDSTIVTNTIFDPQLIDSTYFTANTCDPAMVGVSSNTIAGADGCDSVLITNTILQPSPVITFSFSTCNPAQAGTVTQVLQTVFGCDSTVVTNTVFDPQLIDTTYLTANTCDPAMAGISTNTITGADGCDSVLITNTMYLPGNCNPFEVQLDGVGVSCFGDEDGKIIITVLSGVPPFQYSWAGNGSTGNGNISNTNQPEIITGLEPGTYMVTISPVPANGEDTTAIFVLNVPTELLIAPQITSNFNGFPIKCTDSADGTAAATATGGTAPFSYNWSNGSTISTAQMLPAGQVWLTVTDAKGCFKIDSLVLTAPPPVMFELQTNDETCLDDQNGSIAANWISGGVQPIEFELDNDGFSSTNNWENLPAGTYNVRTRDAYGCISDAVSAVIQPGTILTLEAGADTTVLSGDSLLLTVTTSHAVDSVIWLPEESVYPVSDYNVLVFPAKSTIYEVRAIDENGCEATDRIRVSVDTRRQLYAPNVICPECPDAQNAVFTIYGGDGIREVDLLRIFDRWGNAVFEKHKFPLNDPAYGWNGTYPKNNTDGHVAVYVFYAIIRLSDDSTITLKGDITVVR